MQCGTGRGSSHEKELTNKGNRFVLEERKCISLLHMEEAEMDSVHSPIYILCLQKSEEMNP